MISVIDCKKALSSFLTGKAVLMNSLLSAGILVTAITSTGFAETNPNVDWKNLVELANTSANKQQMGDGSTYSILQRFNGNESTFDPKASH